MADFQSFLFQSMQAIGLNEDLAAKKPMTSISAVSNINSNFSSIRKNSSNYNTLNQSKSAVKAGQNTFKNFANMSNATEATMLNPFATKPNQNNMNNHYDLKNNQKQTNNNNFNSSSSVCPLSSIPINDTYPSSLHYSSNSNTNNNNNHNNNNNNNLTQQHLHNSNQMNFETPDSELEQNCSMIRSESTKDDCCGAFSSSDSTPIKTSAATFKSSTPIVNSPNDDDSSSHQTTTLEPPNKCAMKHRNFSIKSRDTERGVKSPQFFRKPNANSTQFRTKKETLTEEEGSFADDDDAKSDIIKNNKSDQEDESNYQISSGFFKKHISNSSHDDEPEEEAAAESNCMQKNIFTPCATSSSKLKAELSRSPSFIKDMVKKFQKKFNAASLEPKLADESDEEQQCEDQEEYEEESIEEVEYDEHDDDFAEMSSLRELTKSKIPWESLSGVSSKILIDAVRSKDPDCPILFSHNEHKISQSQAKKWFKVLEDCFNRREFKRFVEKSKKTKAHHYTGVKELPAAPPRSSPAGLGKIAVERRSKRPVCEEAATSLLESPRSISKLYTHVSKVKNKAAGLGQQGDVEEVNKRCVNKSQSGTNKNHTLNHDHFYNEISELDHMQKLMTVRKMGRITPAVHETVSNSLEAALIQNVNLKRTISNLKSPERQILYNDWFKIVKKMETDPKFDLEALIRTRGRFTDHEIISYRDKLLNKTKNGSNSVAAAKIDAGTLNYSKSTLNKMASSSYTSKAAAYIDTMNSKSGSAMVAAIAKSEATKISSKNNEESWENSQTRKAANNVTVSKNKTITDVNNATLSSPFKLTLEKNDINYIKDILSKKGGKPDLSKLSTFGHSSGGKVVAGKTNQQINSYYKYCLS